MCVCVSIKKKTGLKKWERIEDRKNVCVCAPCGIWMKLVSEMMFCCFDVNDHDVFVSVVVVAAAATPVVLRYRIISQSLLSDLGRQGEPSASLEEVCLHLHGRGPCRKPENVPQDSICSPPGSKLAWGRVQHSAGGEGNNSMHATRLNQIMAFIFYSN